MFRFVALWPETCFLSGNIQSWSKFIQNGLFSNRISILQSSLRSKQTRHSKKRINCSKNTALHFDFHEKVNQWKKLLRNEASYEVKEIVDLRQNPSKDELEQLNQISGTLFFQKQYFHALHGRIIVLQPLKETDRQDTIKTFFRSGTPVMLCRSPKLTNIADCIVISYSENEVLLKTKSKKELNVDSSDQFLLIPSAGLGYLIALNEFLELKWKDFPGARLIHYVHCNVPLPISRPDEFCQEATGLNESQRLAVAAALNKSRPLVTIYGPPGTGKTAVITEIVIQAVRSKQKVLICAPSNTAVNNIVDHLKNLTGICSLGFKSELSLAYEVEQHDKFIDVQCAFNELNVLDLDKEEKICKGSVNGNRKAWRDANNMLWDLKKSILSNKQIVACTLTNSALRFLREQGFQPNLTIIDEAAQALECVAWYSMLLAPKAVVVGDPWQLPPVLKTLRLMKDDNIGNSLIDTLFEKFGETASFMLFEQYRMNKKIMEWPSAYFYKSKLCSNERVANQLLSDMSGVTKGSLFDEPLLFIDTSRNKMEISKEKLCRYSYANALEAELIIKYVSVLNQFGVREEDIAVIAPYTAQVHLLRKSLKKIPINSVDAFQGQEREVIILSLVRNNDEGRIGFLRDERRLNVAITRARRQFVVVGSAKMMKHAKHLQSFMNHMLSSGKIIQPNDLAENVAAVEQFKEIGR